MSRYVWIQKLDGNNAVFYEATNHIHAGLDFFASNISDVKAGCVNSACFRVLQLCDGIVHDLRSKDDTGYEAIIRCDSREGSRSNVYLAYNHLYDHGLLQPNMRVTTQADYDLFVYQFPSSPSPHLHLEMYYDRDATLDNSIRLNPILFFAQDVVTPFLKKVDDFYPQDNPPDWEPGDPILALEWGPADRNCNPS